jgi:hypothetical protein
LIISHIIGGLGNQMFQYAAGRALSLRKNTELRLDISGFASYGLHQGFELKRVFTCPAVIASDSDINRVLGWQSKPIIRRLMTRQRFAKFRRDAFAVEPHFYYWPKMDDLKTDCYLSGYWQSEKYFADVAAQIRIDFAFRKLMNLRNADFAEKIQQGNAISLHVRRGDYANNPKTTAAHGLCSLEYYKSAIQYVINKVDQPCFYIFSDDPTWVRENIKIDFPSHYVDHNKGEESYNDMRLMSMCKHHIIANSSFSWWGAWLNPSPDKIVIAPQKWFAKETNTRDLIPQDWIRL